MGRAGEAVVDRPVGGDAAGSAGGADAVLIDALAAQRKVLAREQAREAALMLEFAEVRQRWDQRRIGEIEAEGRDARYTAGEFAAVEIGLAVKASRASVRTVLGVARRLRSETPDAYDAWLAGEIDQPRAVKINHALLRLTRDDSKELLNSVVVDIAVCKTAELLGRWLNEFVATVEPDQTDERLRRSLDDRYVSVRPDLDGISFLSAAVSSVDASAVDQVLTALAAAAAPGDPRTLQQRRADALVDVLLGRVSNGCHVSWVDDDDQAAGDEDADPVNGRDDHGCDCRGSGGIGDDDPRGSDVDGFSDDSDADLDHGCDGDRGAGVGGAAGNTGPVDHGNSGPVDHGDAGPADHDDDMADGAVGDQGRCAGRADATGPGHGGADSDAADSDVAGPDLVAPDDINAKPDAADRADAVEDAGAGNAERADAGRAETFDEDTGAGNVERADAGRAETPDKDAGAGNVAGSDAGRAETPDDNAVDDWEQPASVFRRESHREDPPIDSDSIDWDSEEEPEPDRADPAPPPRGRFVVTPCPGNHQPNPVPAVIGVIVSAQSLFGFSNTPGQLVDRSALVPADTIRALAEQPGTLFHRLLTDERGNLLDVTELGRFPSRKLGLAINYRDGMCTRPGCHTSATRCDDDHVVPVPDGPTTGINLKNQCRPDHRAKTHAAHQVTSIDQHTTQWTTPTGHTYLNQAPPLPVENWPTERDATAAAPNREGCPRRE